MSRDKPTLEHDTTLVVEALKRLNQVDRRNLTPAEQRLLAQVRPRLGAVADSMEHRLLDQ